MNPSDPRQTPASETNIAGLPPSETQSTPVQSTAPTIEVASASSASASESPPETEAGPLPDESPPAQPTTSGTLPGIQHDAPLASEQQVASSEMTRCESELSSRAAPPPQDAEKPERESPLGSGSHQITTVSSGVESEQTASSVSGLSAPIEATGDVKTESAVVGTLIGDTPSAGETASSPQETSSPAAEKPSAPPRPPQPIPPVPAAPQPQDLACIAQDLQIRKSQVEAVLHLLDDHYAPPFIARYRKDQTGGLSEETIRRIQQRVRQLREIAARKQTILRTLAYQHRLTDELTQAILQAETLKRLEDLFLPFRHKKKSPAKEARDKGLGPVAEAIWNRDPAVTQLDEVLAGLVDPDKWLLTTEDVLNGIKVILKEMIAEHADVRGEVRKFLWETGVLVAQRVETLPEGKGKEFQLYFDFKEAVREIPPHRILAITRGERLNVLRVRIQVDRDRVVEMALQKLSWGDHPHRELLMSLTRASVEEILLPALEKEVRRDLLQQAQEHAVQVFARNLRSLLLQPPVRDRKVLAIDPSNRNITTVVVLNEDGGYVEDAVIHVSGPHRNLSEAKRRLEQLIRRHQLSLIAIGNGGNYRDVEALVSELIADLERGGGKSPIPPTPPAASAPVSALTQPAAVPPPVETVSITEAGTPLPAPEVSLTSETLAVTGPSPVPSTTAIPIVAVPTVAVPPGETTFTTTVTGLAATVTTMPSETAGAAGSAEGPPTSGPPASGQTPLEVVPFPAPSPAAIESVGPAPVEATVTTTTTILPISPPETVPAPASPIDLEGLPPAPKDLAYAIVIEAGIRDYAHSPIAQEEFPTLSPAIRAAISVGRRLLDPLAELVKIEPHHIGVGLYQHDVKQKYLKEALEAVVVSSVNAVGVDLNRAEYPLLRYVCGLNPTFAREIVTRRRQHGPFRHRRQLLEISGLTEKHYVQAAGFVKICDGEEPLDGLWIHPEQYDLARAILEACGLSPLDLRDPQHVSELASRLATLSPAEFAARFHVSEGTVRDVMHALSHPGRDPRLDHPPPLFKRGMLKFEDIRPGMELRGTVLNVVPFGAFIDIGLRESGLVHISQMANRYIHSPHELVAVGDAVTVWVLDVKPEVRKISLTMIPPGQERRPPSTTGERQPTARERREGPAPPPPPRGGTPRGPRSERSRRGQGAPSGSRTTSAEGTTRPARGPRPTPPTPQQPASSETPRKGEPAGSAPPAPTATAEPTPARASQTPSSAPPPPPAPRRSPRPPAKPKPLPILPPEKRSGKAALNTFAELAAFFKQQEESASATEEKSSDVVTASSPTGETGSPATSTPAEHPPQ
jgi:uncharacterized protein